MKITTTQHIRVEFDDGYVKEISEQEAKELHLFLKQLFERDVQSLKEVSEGIINEKLAASLFR